MVYGLIHMYVYKIVPNIDYFRKLTAPMQVCEKTDELLCCSEYDGLGQHDDESKILTRCLKYDHGQAVENWFKIIVWHYYLQYCYGVQNYNEETALKTVEEVTGKRIVKCGLFTDDKFPYIWVAATPGGILEDGQGVVENNCAQKIFEQYPKGAAKKGLLPFLRSPERKWSSIQGMIIIIKFKAGFMLQKGSTAYSAYGHLRV